MDASREVDMNAYRFHWHKRASSPLPTIPYRTLLDRQCLHLDPGESGGYWAEASEHQATRIGAQGQQPSRSHGPVTLPASPIPPPLPPWDSGLHACPHLYLSPTPTFVGTQCQPQWPSGQHAASSFQALYHATAPQSLHGSSSYSQPFETLSIQPRAVMSSAQHFQSPGAHLYPVGPGSEDSQTLRSFTTSQDQGQDEILDCSFDELGELTSLISGQATLGCFSTNDCREIGVASGQYGHNIGHWQSREQEMPWSPINPSRIQLADLNQGQCIAQVHADSLDFHNNYLTGQYLHPSVSYPSQILSPVTDTSYHLNEADPADTASQCRETLSNNIEDLKQFSDHAFHPLGRHWSPSNSLWPPASGPRTMDTIFRPQSPATQEMVRDRGHSIESPEVFDEITQRPRGSLLAPNHQATCMSLAPLRPSVHVWENTSVFRGALQQSSTKNASKEARKRKTGRKGPLDKDRRKKARSVRQHGACWKCWLLHLSCSLEPVCAQCQPPPFSLHSNICNKTHPRECVDLLFPPLLVAQRLSLQVQQQIDESINGFSSDPIVVYLSSGPRYPPLTITAHEFYPKHDRADELLSQYYAPADVHAPLPTLEQVYCPPLAIRDIKDYGALRDSCQKHIRGMIKESRFSKEATADDKPPLLQEVFDAVNRYRNSESVLENTDSLLGNATKLYAMHFFMSRAITFTKESAKNVIENLPKPMQLPYGRRISSKLLTMQIKQEINLLQREVTIEVLDDLEKQLRRRRESWATCFCVIIILSMCIEAVQVAADGFVVKTMIEKNDTNIASRDAAIDIARRLDNKLYKDCVYIFHLIHRSGERKSRKKFNPIRDGITIDVENGIDEKTVHLVNDIRRIIGKYQQVLGKKAENPSWEYKGDLLADHYRFRQRNSGRLVAKFLKSFLDGS